MLIKTIASIAIALPLVVPVQAIAGNVHQISSTRRCKLSHRHGFRSQETEEASPPTRLVR